MAHSHNTMCDAPVDDSGGKRCFPSTGSRGGSQTCSPAFLPAAAIRLCRQGEEAHLRVQEGQRLQVPLRGIARVEPVDHRLAVLLRALPPLAAARHMRTAVGGDDSQPPAMLPSQRMPRGDGRRQSARRARCIHGARRRPATRERHTEGATGGTTGAGRVVPDVPTAGVGGPPGPDPGEEQQRRQHGHCYLQAQQCPAVFH